MSAMSALSGLWSAQPLFLVKVATRAGRQSIPLANIALIGMPRASSSRRGFNGPAVRARRARNACWADDMADGELRAALLDLLESLEAIGTEHEEVYDTDVRERMSEAVYKAFLNPVPGYQLPLEFGMFEPNANAAVRAAISGYVERAAARAAVLALSDPKARLAAFQDEDVMTRGEEQYPDDFFGWAESI